MTSTCVNLFYLYYIIFVNTFAIGQLIGCKPVASFEVGKSSSRGIIPTGRGWR